MYMSLKLDRYFLIGIHVLNYGEKLIKVFDLCKIPRDK